MTDSQLACGLNEPRQVHHRHSLIQELKQAVQEKRELSDGYALRFPGEEQRCRKLTDFIAFERVCCPFLVFEMKFEAFGGPIWLHVMGPHGVKDVIQREAASAAAEG